MLNDVAVRVGELEDRDLLLHLKRCVAEEREVTARLLEHFAEVDARGLYRDQGFSSMFEYAVYGLYMSESEAGLRITVSRLVRQFPQALEMLGRGEIHLTALRLLAPRLTSQNLELLQQARFKSKHEVQKLIALHFPQPDVSDSIRRLPVPCSGSAAPAGLAASSPAVRTHQRDDGRGLQHDSGHGLPRDAAHGGGYARRAPTAAACIPLSEGRFKVQFTAGQQLHDKLKQAQELMRHRTASGDLAVVLECAVDLLIAERKKQLFGKAAKPRRSRRRNAGAESARQSRYVPRALRREVVERAAEQCTFVAPDGHRCSARGRLELDHRLPRGRGGRASADNLRVLCRSHNLLMAERIYGRAFMRGRIESARQTRVGSPSTMRPVPTQT